METIYRKVAVSERNPTKEDIYNTSRGFLSYSKVFGWVTIQNYTTPNPEYWIEEIPDPTAQLKSDKEELLEALEIFIEQNTPTFTSHDYEFPEHVMKAKSLIQKYKQ